VPCSKLLVLPMCGRCTQGFPRADIDIPRIAADRSRLAGGVSLHPQASPIPHLTHRSAYGARCSRIEQLRAANPRTCRSSRSCSEINIPLCSLSLLAAVLQNDYKRLSNDLEAAIVRVHEAARLSATLRTDAPDATQPAPAQPATAQPAPAQPAPAGGARTEATAGVAAVPHVTEASESGAQAARAEPGPSGQATEGAPMETEEADSCQGTVYHLAPALAGCASVESIVTLCQSLLKTRTLHPLGA